VIVSGDSDFLPLVSKLRELGKYVILIAQKASACPLFESFCDEVLYIPAKPKTPADDQLELGVAVELVTRAVEGLVARSRKPDLSSVKSEILTLDPEFDQTRFGVAQFKQLMVLLEAKKVIRLRAFNKKNLLVELVMNDDASAVSLSKPSQPKKHGVNDTTSLNESLAEQVLDRLYWVNKLRELSGGTALNMSLLGSRIRRLYPDLGLRQLGLSKQFGWLSLMQKLEEMQYCRLISLGNGKAPAIEFTERFHERTVTAPKPERFDEFVEELLVRYKPRQTIPTKPETLRVFDDGEIIELDKNEDKQAATDGVLWQLDIPF
jgi:hypothetical protein